MKTWEHYKKAGKARRRCLRNRYKNIMGCKEGTSVLKSLLNKIHKKIIRYSKKIYREF